MFAFVACIIFLLYSSAQGVRLGTWGEMAPPLVLREVRGSAAWHSGVECGATLGTLDFIKERWKGRVRWI